MPLAPSHSRPVPPIRLGCPVALLAIVCGASTAFAQVANDKPRAPDSKRLPLADPPKMPDLPTVPTAPGGSAPVVTPVPDAPTPRELWDRYIEACGGKDAIRGSGSRRTKGTIHIPAAGMKGTVETFAKSPDKVLVKTTLGQFGEMQQAFDGTIGWANDSMSGARLLEGAELDAFRRDAAYDGPFGYIEAAREAKTLGSATFNGIDCWVVELKEVMGGDLTCYFDKTEHLLRGMRTTSETPMGKMPVEMVLTDYATFGGAKYPSRTLTRVMMQEFNSTVDEVSWDEIDDSVFTPPPSVQALINSRKGGASAPSAPEAPGAPPQAPKDAPAGGASPPASP